jgi:hypothetical protein
MFQFGNTPGEAAPPSSQGISAPEGDDTWLREYSQHLNRLYEPAADCPLDIEKLVTALANLVAQPDPRNK